MERYENFQEEKKRMDSGRTNKCSVPVLCCVLIVVMFFLGGLLGYRLNFEYWKVDGRSMQNTLNPSPVEDEKGVWQDGVIIEKGNNPARNDIVVVSIPGEKYPLIKRVIAKGGDMVTIKKVSVDVDENNNPIMEYRIFLLKKGATYIEMLEEDYIKDYKEWSNSSSQEYNSIEYDGRFFETFLNAGFADGEKVIDINNTLYYQVPQNTFFYLGDNRANSSDSRRYGVSKSEQIKGSVRVIVHDSEKNFGKTDNWLVFKAAFSYIFGQISEFFAWTPEN